MSTNRESVPGQSKIISDVDAHDVATLRLSPEFREWLSERDIGDYSMTKIWELVQKHGEAKVRLALLADLNCHIYETYGRNHPQFDPRLPFRRPKK